MWATLAFSHIWWHTVNMFWNVSILFCYYMYTLYTLSLYGFSPISYYCRFFLKQPLSTYCLGNDFVLSYFSFFIIIIKIYIMSSHVAISISLLCIRKNNSQHRPLKNFFCKGMGGYPKNNRKERKLAAPCIINQQL